mmetsp:Transcript_139013/g.432486  ORF Transcript_139013/g.432486 Transcript_139013/m.432486 type:complete len:396 (+) Transcript_139013:309-1496(+)
MVGNATGSLARVAGAMAGNATASLAHVPGSRDLGPTMHEFLGFCWQAQPIKILSLLGSASLCFLVTLAVTLRHRCQLLRQPISLRRVYYLRIVNTPSLLSAMALLALYSPSSFLLASLVSKFYEAVTLSTFGMLLFTLLWHESHLLEAANGEAQEEGRVEVVAHALARSGRRKHFGAPPCCFLLPCLPKHDLSVQHLSAIFIMVRQYVFVTPLVGVLGLAIFSAVDMDTLDKASKTMKYILIVSSFICLWGLFIAYKSSHDLLHHWNTTRKFFSIKAVLIIMVWQESLLDHVGPHVLRSRDISCFRHVGFRRAWEDVESHWWGMWLLTLEMVLMALALVRAFPAEEIRESIPEIHHDLLDMEMSRKIARDTAKSEDGTQGTEDSEEDLEDETTDE